MIKPLRSIFVSPHFDDVALSCGGTVAMAADGGAALVVTVFSGEANGPLSDFAAFQHARWQTGAGAVVERRAEDGRAMAILAAPYRWLQFPDAIYRGDLYRSDDDLFGAVRPADQATAAAVVASLSELVAEYPQSRVYLPLAVGGHVDHRICRAAAPVLRTRGAEVWLYEDFPYAAATGTVEAATADARQDRALGSPVLVDVTKTIDRRLAAVAAYASQLPTIFRHFGEPETVTRAYAGSLSPVAGRYAERFWVVT
jgi:LmbE family N-acetylglucosaminyl deacetylase